MAPPAGSAAKESPYPADSAVAEWLNSIGEGYAAKLYKVFEECGYEQKQDLEGMTKDEGRALMEAVEQRGAKAPQLRRLRAALETMTEGGDGGK